MTRPEPPSSVIPFRTRAGSEPRLTKRQVAAHYKVSERTIERWMLAGMPYDRPPVGRVVRFRLSEVEAWLEGGADGDPPAR